MKIQLVKSPSIQFFALISAIFATSSMGMDSLAKAVVEHYANQVAIENQAFETNMESFHENLTKEEKLERQIQLQGNIISQKVYDMHKVIMKNDFKSMAQSNYSDILSKFAMIISLIGIFTAWIREKKQSI